MIDVRRNETLLANASQGALNGVRLADLLIVRREGMAMRYEAAQTTLIDDFVAFSSFRYMGEKPSPTPPNASASFVRHSNQVIDIPFEGVRRRQSFDIDEHVFAGWTFGLSSQISGEVMFSYTVQEGDTRLDVASALAALIDPMATYDALVTDEERLSVKMLLSESLTPSVTWSGQQRKYFSGYFTTINLKNYLVGVQEDASDYPDLPALGILNFSALSNIGTQTPDQYLFDPVYPQQFYELTSGLTKLVQDIPDSPVAGSDPDKVYIYDEGDIFILGTPAEDLTERFDFIYKRIL